MEIHKAIIPCERCENSSKLHQIKPHFMTSLVSDCRNTCVSENLCVFFFTKCNIHVNYQNLNSSFFSCSSGLIIKFVRFISL